MIAVSSSNVRAVDHDGRDLLVAFRNGSLYRYFSVPYEVFCRLLNATSKGGFLARYIKPYYRYRRIR
jgi:hypothetical protein